jgi:hypothetical protein
LFEPQDGSLATGSQDTAEEYFNHTNDYTLVVKQLCYSISGEIRQLFLYTLVGDPSHDGCHKICREK